MTSLPGVYAAPGPQGSGASFCPLVLARCPSFPGGRAHASFPRVLPFRETHAGKPVSAVSILRTFHRGGCLTGGNRAHCCVIGHCGRLPHGACHGSRHRPGAASLPQRKIRQIPGARCPFRPSLLHGHPAISSAGGQRPHASASASSASASLLRCNAPIVLIRCGRETAHVAPWRRRSRSRYASTRRAPRRRSPSPWAESPEGSTAARAAKTFRFAEDVYERKLEPSRVSLPPLQPRRPPAPPGPRGAPKGRPRA